MPYLPQSALVASSAPPPAPAAGPGDLGVYLVGLRIGAKAAIDPGDDVLAPQHVSVARDALCYHLGMLDDVRCRVDDPGISSRSAREPPFTQNHSPSGG